MYKNTFRFPGMIGVISILVLATIVFLLLVVPSEAGRQCSKILNVSGFESLINNCNSCLNIQVIRDRAGYGKATLRTFKMVKSGEFPLPFKGKGKTRILSEESCGSLTMGEKKSADTLSAYNIKCIIPVRTTKGIAMANTCDTCRAFIIERLYETGERIHKPYALMAGQSIPLPSEGAMHAEIIHDAACKM